MKNGIKINLGVFYGLVLEIFIKNNLLINNRL
jgi:hypothetical protein